MKLKRTDAHSLYISPKKITQVITKILKSVRDTLERRLHPLLVENLVMDDVVVSH
jgi:hypothetical protein